MLTLTPMILCNNVCNLPLSISNYGSSQGPSTHCHRCKEDDFDTNHSKDKVEDSNEAEEDLEEEDGLIEKKNMYLRRIEANELLMTYLHVYRKCIH